MKRTLKYLNKPLLVYTIIFISFGLLMIQSASSMESYMRYGNSPYRYFFKQLIIVGGSLIPAIIILNTKTKRYEKYSFFLMAFSLLSLVALKVMGYAVHDAKSWFDLGFFSLQPSEIIKLAIIVSLACYYDKHKNNLANTWTLFAPFILFVIPVALLVIIQPDLGTGSIILMLSGLILYAVPMPKKSRNYIHKIILGAILIILVIILVTKGSILKGYQLDRFNFLSPCERYQEDSGYQLCNSFIAFNNGGLTGQGIGESTQKYLYLPESYTDFIFPIIVEEWGLMIGIVIILMYALLLLTIYQVAKRAKNLRDSLLAYGVLIYVLLHIAVNLMGVTGLMPLTGVPLPFLSYGGSYALTLIMAIAVVQRVNIETKKAEAKMNDKK